MLIIIICPIIHPMPRVDCTTPKDRLPYSPEGLCRVLLLVVCCI